MKLHDLGNILGKTHLITEIQVFNNRKSHKNLCKGPDLPPSDKAVIASDMKSG